MRKNLRITLPGAALLIWAFSLAVTGCRKRTESPSDRPLQVEEITTTSDPAQPIITIPPDHTLLPTKPSSNFIFDWEHATNMPVAPGQPAVPVPWSDQAIKNYDPGLQYDFKKEDGWELVYNNFSESVTSSPYIFMLYNKFRGVLRFYSYNPTSSNPSVDSYRSLINEIELFSTSGSSPLFNYAGQQIIDIHADTRAVSRIEPWPITLSGWYISQFEMAYDKNMASHTLQQFGCKWILDFAKVDEMELNDVAAANKITYLQKQDVQFTDLGSRGAPLTGNMQLQVKTMNDFDNLTGVFPDQTIANLKQAVTDTVAGKLLSALLVPSQGIAECKLDVPATLLLDNNLVGYLPGLSLALPGMDNSQVIGLGPVFNESLGIFYLGSQPVVQHSKSTGDLAEQYSLDVPSIEYIINPFIKSYADVRNFHQEIVAIDAKETANLTEATIYRGQVLKASAPLNVLGVRVSFEVVPKNGSAPVKIIKTFKADVKGG